MDQKTKSFDKKYHELDKKTKEVEKDVQEASRRSAGIFVFFSVIVLFVSGTLQSLTHLDDIHKAIIMLSLVGVFSGLLFLAFYFIIQKPMSYVRFFIILAVYLFIGFFIIKCYMPKFMPQEKKITTEDTNL